MDSPEAALLVAKASAELSLGLAGLLAELLPTDNIYKLEVLLEIHNDTLREIALDIEKGRGK